MAIAKPFLAGSRALFAGGLAALPAAGQGSAAATPSLALEEVTVTARRREESLQ